MTLTMPSADDRGRDESKLVTLFPSVLLRTRVADHQAIGKRLLPDIDRIRAVTPNAPAPAWACPVYSTLLSDAWLHRREAFREVASVFHDEVQALAERLSVDRSGQTITIDRCWLSVLARGHSIDVHNQPNSFFTGVYFLQAPADGACLCLHNPTQEIGISLPMSQETPLNQESFVYRPTPGDLLIFESSLTQSLQVHNADQEHINLSFTAVANETRRPPEEEK